jgi:tetratricopeptide (TPR) repeat protein
MTDPATLPAAPPPTPTRLSRRRWLFAGLALLVVAAGGLGWWWATRPRPAPDTTPARLDEAKAALAAAHFPEARDHLRAVLDAWPLDAETHYLLARAYRRDDDLADWDYHLRTAARLQWPSEEIEREQLLARIQAGDLRRADSLPPSADPDADVLVTEAVAKGCLASFRLDELLAVTQEWIDRRPGDWQPYFLRGQGYAYGRLLNRAADEYRAVLERYPGHPTARVRLGSALMVDGLYEPARAEFEMFLATNPQHPEALVGLANCQMNLAQPDAARATLDRLFAFAPDHPGGCYLLAQLEAASDPAAALEWLRRAEKRAPRETDITNALIRVLNQLGRTDEAARYQKQLDDLRADLLRLDEVRRSVRRDPDRPGPRLEAGRLCARLGRTAEAANWFDSVLVIDPANEAAGKGLTDLAQPRPPAADPGPAGRP